MNEEWVTLLEEDKVAMQDLVQLLTEQRQNTNRTDEKSFAMLAIATCLDTERVNFRVMRVRPHVFQVEAGLVFPEEDGLIPGVVSVSWFQEDTAGKLREEHCDDFDHPVHTSAINSLAELYENALYTPRAPLYLVH